MSLYSDTLASHSYRFKRLILAHSNTEIEQIFRDARLLFEELDKILEALTEKTEAYHLNLEQIVDDFKKQKDISKLKKQVSTQYQEFKKLI